MTTHLIKHWFELAVPNPTERTKNVQYGVHMEEKAEELEAIGEKAVATKIHAIADSYKSGSVQLNLEAIDRLELLDSLCDQIVTAIGMGHAMGFNICGAISEVNRSNYSKFVDGKAIFDANGKIAKGPGYTKPNLTPYLTYTPAEDIAFKSVIDLDSL